MDLSGGISSLEDDIQEFNIEKDVKTSLKTQEELDKLTVDETLNDVDRAVYILSSGQELQCVSVVQNFPQLLKGWQNECVRRIIPKLKDVLHTAGLDVQMAATEVFATVAKEELLSMNIYTQHFLRTIITNMNTKDPVASQAWLDCLISVIPYLPRDIVRREILGLAIAKGQLSQPTASRLSCCSILGAVAPKFDSNVIKKDIIQTVKQLCQDVEHNVRTCMCSHLHAIASALGPEETKKTILEEVLELAGDEEVQVREAALDTLLNMTSLLDDETIRQSVVPITCKYCEQAIQNEDATMISVSKQLGRFSFNLSAYFNPEQNSWLLASFRHLCQLGRSEIEGPMDNLGERGNSPVNPEPPVSPNTGALRFDPEKREDYIECRRNCAYNFPAITQFCGSSMFEEELLYSLTLLCTDSDPTVRKYMAAGLHEIAQLLEANAYLVQPHLVHMLRERNSSAVLEACIKKLPDTLTAVIVRGNLADNKVQGVSELINALLAATSRLEQQWPSAWRALETMVTHMRRLPDVFTSDQIYNKFVNVVFTMLTNNRYLPVREAAACSICVFIRHNLKLDQRSEMCSKLVNDLCYSTNFRNRILFFTACRHMMALFSRTYFKENLFEHVLQLFTDPVPNVRLCLCRILPSMKTLLKLPRDRILHQNLELNVRKLLSTETDRDVYAAIRQAIHELDRIKISMDSLTQEPQEFDLEDRRKEDEERLLVEREERTRDEDARSMRSHGSSHSSSSIGRTIKGDKNTKRSRCTSFHSQPSLKVNGSSKEKSRSSQHLNVPGGAGSSQSRDSSSHSTGSSSSTSSSAPYTVSSSGTGSRSNLSNHFSHGSYLPSSNTSASRGPSTALGHKSPHIHQPIVQSRSSPATSSPGAFSGTLPSQNSLSAPSSQISQKTSKKINPRKLSSIQSDSSACESDNSPLSFESRSRKGSTGSVSSGGKPFKPSLRRKGSLPGSPVSSSTSTKGKRDRNPTFK